MFFTLAFMAAGVAFAGGGGAPEAMLTWVPHKQRPLPTIRFPQAQKQEQLSGDPGEKPRPCLCQFGVGLKTGVPGYYIGQPIDADKLGHHSYGKHVLGENNGQIYTCGAGFVDTTHVRAGIDWTAHLAVVLDRMIDTGGTLDFSEEGGGVRLVITRAKRSLGREDVLRLAERIAYERLIWHEVMSWYYHPPERVIGEQQSAFSPEDAPSDFLGTLIAAAALTRVEESGIPFEDAVDATFNETLAELHAAPTAEDTTADFKLVDRHENAATSGLAWYDSEISFWNNRYLFKRNIDVLRSVPGWLLPAGKAIGCEPTSRAFVGHVPAQTVAGDSLTWLYEWQFTPEPRFSAGTGVRHAKNVDPRFQHSPLPLLVTDRDLPRVVAQVRREIEAEMGPQFDDPAK